MPHKTLILLENGLRTLEAEVEAKKSRIQADLALRKPISIEDEDWIDNGGGNLVDHTLLVDSLKAARTSQKHSLCWISQRKVL